MVEAGLTPTETLAAATSRAAEMFGEGDVFGIIEPGKRAGQLLLVATPISLLAQEARHPLQALSCSPAAAGDRAITMSSADREAK